MEMRAEPGRSPRSMVASSAEPRAPPPLGGSPWYAERPLLPSPSASGVARERGPQAPQGSPIRAPRRGGGEAGEAGRPRRQRARRREAGRRPAAGRRCAGRRRRRIPRETASRRVQTGVHTVEVGAPRGRAALDDDQAVGGEGKRRKLARKGSVEARRAPSSSAVFPPPLDSRTVTSCATRSRASPERDPGRRPPRTGSAGASERVRGENPCSPTWTASSRFVLPAPFGADDEHEPRLERRGRAARTTGSSRSETRADDQPASRIGMIRYVKSSLSPWSTAGPERADQLERPRRRRRTRCPSRRNSALKPISSGSAANGAGSVSRASPTSCVCARHRQLALGEAQAQRRVPLRHHARRGGRRRAAPRAAAAPRARTARATAAGSSGTGRRSGGWSATRRRRRRRPGSRARPARAARSPPRDAAELRQRAGRDDRLELRHRRRRSAVSFTARRYESVAAITSLPALEADEDPGQHRARLVARRRAAHRRDRLEQRVARRR